MNMKMICKKTINRKHILTFLGLLLTICFIFSKSIFAAGTVDLQVSAESCAVGDEVKVTVNVHDAGSASKPEVSVTYDPNRLSFIDCSSEYGGGGGGLITVTDATSEITFTTVSGGPAEVKVSAIFDGDGANAQESSAVISVDGEDTAEGMNEEVSTDTGIEAGTIMSGDGTKYVSSVFANEFMPVGFYKTSVTYEEQMVEAAQFDMGNIVLLYVTDENGNNGNFDVYNQETGELSDFLQIMGIENRFIIVLKAGDDIEAPAGFTKTTLQWNDQTLDAYAYSGDTFQGDTNPAEFFIVYAVSSTGNRGFYLYDQTEGTYQRYVEGFRNSSSSSFTDSDDNESKNVIEEVTEGVLSKVTNSDDDSKKGGLDIKLIIIVILAIVATLLLVLFIITLTKLKDYESYDYIEEDEEFYEEKAPKVKMSDGLVYPDKSHNGNKPDKDSDKNSDRDSDKKANRDANRKSEEKPVKKVKASDLVERDMAENKEKEYNKKKLKQAEEETKDADEAEDIEDIEGIEEIDLDSNGSGLNMSKSYYEDRSSTADSEYREYDNDEEYSDDREMRNPFSRGASKDSYKSNNNELDDRKLTREEKKQAKAEAKAAKKEAKRIKREYGENGYVDWESFGESLKNNENEMPKAKANPTYVLDEDKAKSSARSKHEDNYEDNYEEIERKPVINKKSNGIKIEPVDAVKDSTINIEPVVKEVQKLEKEGKLKSPADDRPKRNYEEMRNQEAGKENPAEMMRNIPANDNNKPVQPKPVQQYDFDEDFEFEFLKLDDED